MASILRPIACSRGFLSEFSPFKIVERYVCADLVLLSLSLHLIVVVLDPSEIFVS